MAKVVPGTQNAAVVLTASVVVGVLVVETPVGDADYHTFTVVSLGQAVAGLDAVGAGVESSVVALRYYGM